MSTRLTHDLGTRQFWTGFASRTFAAIGIIATLFGLYNVIEPSVISRLDLPMFLMITIVALIYGAIRSWPRPIQEIYSTPNTQIRLIQGDLFDRKDNLVIGMSDTFDTAIPHIIQSQSIRGQFLARIFRHDCLALDQKLSDALASTIPSKTISKEGKQVAYPIGTIAVIRQNRQHFFCVAYSAMDTRNQAHCTIDNLWISLSSLWEQVRAHTNGEPVAIPVIGGGQSKLSQILPAQDSIRFIAFSFILASRSSKVCDRLDIIVRKEDTGRIDMLDFQAFLTSLKPSG